MAPPGGGSPPVRSGDAHEHAVAVDSDGSLGEQLAGEYAAALAATTDADLEPLRRAGVGPAGLSIGPAYAAIRLTRDRLHFEFDPHGDGFAFILPVRGANPLSPEASDPEEAVRTGPLIDLVAFSAARPHRWALRLGSATWLGCCAPQYMAPAPTALWRTPLHWIGNGATGIVALSRDKRDTYRLLTCLDAILVEDPAHAVEVQELLARPWAAPAVLVRRGKEVRRAAA